MFRLFLTLSAMRATPCGSGRAPCRHGRVFLDAEMKAKALGYQMSPKTSRQGRVNG